MYYILFTYMGLFSYSHAYISCLSPLSRLSVLSVSLSHNVVVSFIDIVMASIGPVL